jgi:hypothetical protein
VASGSLVPGLVFLCDNNSGGPGNIRNYMLTCLRYAIEAGATGVQVPRIRARSAGNKSDLFKSYRPFGYMFSETRFRNAMAEACPHIAVFPVLDSNSSFSPSTSASTSNFGSHKDTEDEDEKKWDLENIPGVAAKALREKLPPERMVRRITPKEFGGTRAGCDNRDPHRHTDRFGAAFRNWINSTIAELKLQPPNWDDNPMLIRLSWGVLWDWPVFRDGPELAASFGGLLRIREDILDIADAVVRAMRKLAVSSSSSSSLSSEVKKEETDGNGSENSNKTVAKRDTPPPHDHGAFLGIHLRTEEDALSQWPTYEMQSQGYFAKAEELGFSTNGMAYLASGSEKEAQKFSQDAAQQPNLQLIVKSKYDLVHGKELDKLKSLSWDQQALVDFAVLLQSDYFMGVSPSSFSINIALKRHLQKDGLYTRPWKVGSTDGRSWLVGKYEKYWDDWLFMFDGMWP